MDFALTAQSLEMGAGEEAKVENLKGGLNRRRLDTASTMAPSPSMSSVGSPFSSPCRAPLGTDMFIEKFSLDAEEPSDGEYDSTLATDEETIDDPVSRVNSPAHKVARLAVAMDSTAKANAFLMTINVVTPDAPWTPRATETPVPGTPRTPTKPRAVRCSFTPPPRESNSKESRPALLVALQNRSLEQVRRVLQESPESVVDEPFWDHNAETPLCCAKRIGCSFDIQQLLKDHGATEYANDMLDGCSPFQVPCTPFPWESAATPFAFPPVFLTSPQAIGESTRFDAHKGWHQDVSVFLGAKRGA